MSGETDGLATEATLNLLNLKVSKGIDDTLASAQQNLVYGRQDGTTAKALKVNTDGELNVECEFNDSEKTAPNIFSSPENPTAKSLKVVPMLLNESGTQYIFQKTQNDALGLAQDTHPLPVNLPHGITYGGGATAQNRSFALKVKDIDVDGNNKQGELYVDVNDDNKERVDTSTKLKLNTQLYGVDTTNTAQSQSLRTDGLNSLMTTDKNITKGNQPTAVGAELQQVLMYGKKPDNTLQPLETLGDRLLVDVLELTASGRITTSNALSSVQICGYNTTDNQFKTLITEQDGTLNTKDTSLTLQNGTATPADTATAQLVYSGLHDTGNNVMRTAKCNEFGEQYVDDMRGRFGASSGTNLNTTLTGSISEQKQVLIIGADNPINPTSLNNIKVDMNGLLKVGDTRTGEIASDHGDTDARQEVYVSTRVSSTNTMKCLQSDTDGALLVKDLAPQTFKPLRNNFTLHSTTINPFTTTTLWNNNQVANTALNKFRWFDMTASYNYADIYFNFHQGTNQPLIAPILIGAYPLYDKNNVPIIDIVNGTQTTEILIVQILSSDAPIDISGMTYLDLQTRINYSEQIILHQDELNTDGISRNYLGSYHGFIPNQYFMFVLRSAGGTIGTAPSQDIRIGLSSRG